jgi:BirA family biotin operon repressor/biotin-[acetyl-CoA-carboxylase] ligase
MIDGRAPVEVFDEIDSTLLEARRRAERGDYGPVWLIAKRQSAGRGRRGRAWSSFEGNLLATSLFVTPQPAAQIALLGFAAGVAIAEAIDEVIGAGAAQLKWPNDVLIGDAKIAGILVDSGAVDTQANWVALAFGINLASAPDNIDQAATSLRAHLPPDAAAPEPLAFLAAIRPKLETWAVRIVGEGFEPLRRAWLQRAYGMGREAHIVQGEQAIDGRLAGLSPRGELELDTATGRRLIAAGDVFLSGVG